MTLDQNAAIDLRYDQRVIAFHGTSRRAARRLLSGEPFTHSENAHDWLGTGIYFWENGHDRALRWGRERYADAAVVGAILQLGHCYDLMDTRFTADLAIGARRFNEYLARSRERAPRNRGKARYLDAAGINWWLTYLATAQGVVFQSVRRGFDEGPPIYPGMAITTESHIQVAVRDPACILGLFVPSGPRP